MKKAITLFAFLLFTTTCNLFAQKQSNSSGWKANFQTQKCFIENKGQFKLNTTDGFNNDVLYVFDGSSQNYYFTKTGVVYELLEIHKPKEKESEEREMRERLKKGKMTAEEHAKMEAEEKRMDIKRDELTAIWVAANPNVQIIAEGKQKAYNSYTFTNAEGKLVNENYVYGYEKLTYQNLYPNIDVVYEMHPQTGVKYSVIVHPGGDVSKVKLKYSKNARLLNDGTIKTKTKLGNFIDHAPVSFYADDKTLIASSYQLTGDVISFKLVNNNPARTVVIDPWTQSPSFNTQWDCVWECDKDAAGNVYIIGGIMPMQLLKYSSAGALQWTYSTPYDTANNWLGTLATDNAGNSYVTSGSVAAIQKVNTSGGLVWNNGSPGGGLSAEFWSITFNTTQTKLVIGGTGGAIPPLPFIYDINMSTGNVMASQQVTGGALLPTQEVRAITACGNGRYYYLSHDSVGYINENFNVCATGSTLPYHINNNYNLGYKCENWRVDNSGICAIKHYKGKIYTHRGDRLDVRDFNSGAIITSVAIPGGSFITGGFGGNQVGCSGVDIDSCGNIYVGTKNSVVKFSPSLAVLATFNTSFVVYDVVVSTNGDIIACGSTGTSTSGARSGFVQSFAASACNVLALVNCDASICTPPAKCITDAPFNLTASTAGGVWSGTGITNATNGTFSPSVSGVGTFKVYYTLPCGKDSTIVTVNSCTAISVCKEANGNLTVSGGTGPYTWSYWSPASSTPITNQTQCTACGGSWTAFVNICLVGGFPATSCNSPAGWVQFTTGVTVTPPAGKDSIRVVDNAGTTVTIYGLATVPLCSPCPTITVTTTPTNASCGLSNGSATTTVTAGVNPYTYTWSNSAVTSSITNVAAGTYTVTVKDANQCSGTATVTIGTSSGPTATSTKTDANCNGANNGSMTVTASGGTGTLTYTWSPNVSTTSSATSLAPNTYSVTVKDANNCSVVTSQTIGQPTAITIATSNVPASCGGNNGSATATPSGGTGAYTYTWAGGATTATASNLAAGTYSVTVKDANLCSATATVTVGSTSSITTTITSTPTGCGAPTGKAKVTVTGGTGPYTYLWSTGQITDSATALAAGYVKVTVTGAGGCTKVDSVLVTTSGVLPNINAGIDTSLTCTRTSLTLLASSSTPGVTFAWSNGTNGASNTVNTANTYTVTATDPGNSCTASDVVIVTLNNSLPNISAGLDTTLTCVRTTLTLQASSTTAGVTFSWSNGRNTANNSVSTANTYTVTATNPLNGCTASDAVNVTLNNTLPTVNAGLDTVLNCVRTSINLQATSTTAGATFAWSNGTNNASTSVSTANTYTVIATNPANGCTASDAVIVTLNNTPPNVDAGLDQVLSCTSSTATLSGSSTTAGVSYAWSGPGIVSGGTTTAPNVNISGTYTLQVTDPANGCTASDAVNVTPDVNTPNIDAGLDQTLTCIVTSVTLTATSTTPGVTFTWSNGTNAASTNVNTANTYTVTVTNPGNSCIAVDQVVVTQNTQIPANVSAGLDQVLTCNVSTATLTASSTTPGVTYAWSNGLGNAATATTSSTGTYTVTITNPSNGCTATDAVDVTNGVQSLSATITAIDPKCNNFNDGNAVAQVTGGTGPFTYTWSSNPNGGNDSVADNLTGPQSVNVTVTDINGCSTTASSTISNPQAPVLTLLPQDTSVEYGSPVQLVATLSNFTAQSYVWSPSGFSCTSCPNPTVNPRAANTTYTVTVTYNNGCKVSAQTLVKAEANNKLYVPNAFTPNKDGNNDIFNVFVSNYKEFSLAIFNRWGEKVFEGTTPEEVANRFPKYGWDGTYKGALQPVEVYAYYATVVFLNGEVQNLKGSVTLIR